MRGDEVLHGQASAQGEVEELGHFPEVLVGGRDAVWVIAKRRGLQAHEPGEGSPEVVFRSQGLCGGEFVGVACRPCDEGFAVVVECDG